VRERTTWARAIAKRIRAPLLAGACALALAGCVAGPNFQNPETPKTDRYVAEQV